MMKKGWPRKIALVKILGNHLKGRTVDIYIKKIAYNTWDPSGHENFCTVLDF